MLRDTIICFSMGIAVVLGFGRTPSTQEFSGGNTIPKKDKCYESEGDWDTWGPQSNAFRTTRDPDDYCMRQRSDFENEGALKQTYKRTSDCWDRAKNQCTMSRENYSGMPAEEQPCSYYRPRLKRGYGTTYTEIAAAMSSDPLFKECTEKCGPCSTPEDRGLDRSTMSDDEQRQDALIYCNPCRRDPGSNKKELTYTIGKKRAYCPCKKDLRAGSRAETWAIETYNDTKYAPFAPADGDDENDLYCYTGTTKSNVPVKWSKNFCPACVDNTAGTKDKVACSDRFKRKNPKIASSACASTPVKCPAYCSTLLETDIGCPNVESTATVWPFTPVETYVATEAQS